MDKKELLTLLKLEKIGQIGCIVRDVSRTVKHYEEIIGIGPFTHFDLDISNVYLRGGKPGLHLKVATAQLGPELQLELLEWVSGDSCHKEFFEKHGEGLQHLAFMTEEFDQVLKRAEALGIEVLLKLDEDVPMWQSHVRAAYLDTYGLIGTLIEILEVKPI